MSKYLVTGGGGFIGSHIVRGLLQAGREVRVLDNFSTGKRENLAGVTQEVELVEGDLRSPADCARACRGVEVVFHEAALPSVPRSMSDPADFHANNIDGTFQLLLAARDAGCRRVVYAASSSAYGDQPELPKRENMLPMPMSPYALNKLVGEYYATVFYLAYGLEAVSLRYFNVFGPRQDPKSQYAAAIPAFITAMLAGRSPTVYGDGEQTRDFTHIDNVVAANLLAAEAPLACGEVINIASGQRISVNQIIADINDILGTRIKPHYEPPRAGDVLHSLADITRARELLGYEPKVTLHEGLRRTIEWYKTI